MSGSNPFDDLADDEDETEESVPETGSETTTDVESELEEVADSSPPGRDTTAETPTVTESTDDSRETSVDGPGLSNSSPPFPYSEAQQKQMYVQDGLWDDFEDMGFDAELELRRSFDVRNVEQRELDTAVIRLVLDAFSAEDIAEMVVQMRGYDPAALDR